MEEVHSIRHRSPSVTLVEIKSDAGCRPCKLSFQTAWDLRSAGRAVKLNCDQRTAICYPRTAASPSGHALGPLPLRRFDPINWQFSFTAAPAPSESVAHSGTNWKELPAASRSIL